MSQFELRLNPSLSLFGIECHAKTKFRILSSQLAIMNAMERSPEYSVSIFYHYIICIITMYISVNLLE